MAGSYTITAQPLPDGSYGITAVATDTAGNATVSGSVSVQIDTTAPAVTITSLTASGSTLTAVGMAGRAAGDDPTVTVTVCGDVLGVQPNFSSCSPAATVGATGQWSATSGSLFPSGYYARAVQRDRAGNTGVSNVSNRAQTGLF